MRFYVDGEQPAGELTPHEEIPGWLVDTDGAVWRRETVFTCANHPYGPVRGEDGDEFTACEQIAREVLELHLLVDDERTERARVELGLCCQGCRWEDTGRFHKVGPLEMFMATNMRLMVHEQSRMIGRSILLAKLGEPVDWAGVVVKIPLVGTPLPKSPAAEAAEQDKP